MAVTTLTNTAYTTGLYGGGSAPLESDPLETTLLSGLTLEKIADRDVWATGLLTYTVIITNGEALAYTNVTFTDELDTQLISYVPNSARLNGAPVDAIYDDQTGLLSITLPDDIEPGVTSITFQVQKL